MSSKVLDTPVNDDTAVIGQVRAGDANAFGILVRKYQDRLFHCLAHLAGNVHEAEDLVQEAFVQAFLKIRSFQGQSSFFTWLYRIAFNLSVTQLRRKRTQVSLDGPPDSPGIDPEDPGEAVTDKLTRDERAAQVQAALATLSPDYRAILVLREMEDCDYETIAEILDLPMGTVRSRLFRARMELRERLQPMLQEMP